MNQLVREGLISVGDKIEFKTKDHKFTAVVGLGGHIKSTVVYRDSCELSSQPIEDIIFSSLTAWSSACVELVTKKNHTRYASWKRVKHVRSGMTLAAIRRTMKVMVRKHRASRKHLYAELNRMHSLVRSLRRTKYSPAMDLKKLDAFLCANSEGKDFKSILKRLRRRASSQKLQHSRTKSTGLNSCASQKTSSKLGISAGSTCGSMM